MIDQRGDRLESGRQNGSGRNGDRGGGDLFKVSLSRLHDHGVGCVKPEGLMATPGFQAQAIGAGKGWGVLECRLLRDIQVETWRPSLPMETKCALGRGSRRSCQEHGSPESPLGAPRRLLPLTFQRNALAR